MSIKNSKKSLSIIIPSYNSAPTVRRLINSIKSINSFGIEIIIIDDASVDRSSEIIKQELSGMNNAIFILNKNNKGAGICRNLGFKVATGKYVLFFDSDDVFHADAIKDIIDLMNENNDIDVSIFQYNYKNEVNDRYGGMSYIDEQIFSTVLEGKSKKIVTLNDHPELTRISNYPWNKIIRNSHYRNNLSFGSTKVHNDIYANWHILTKARKIVVSDDSICTHVLNEKGDNLTNLQSKERLELFEVLTDTYKMLEISPQIRRICAVHFWDLAASLASWSISQIEDKFKKDFNLEYIKLIEIINLEDILLLRKSGYNTVLNNMASRMLCNG